MFRYHKYVSIIINEMLCMYKIVIDVNIVNKITVTFEALFIMLYASSLPILNCYYFL